MNADSQVSQSQSPDSLKITILPANVTPVQNERLGSGQSRAAARFARWAGSAFVAWVCFALVAIPFLVVPLVPGAAFYDNQRLLQLSCAVLALAVVCFQLVSRQSLPGLFGRPVARLLLAFLGLGLLSASLSFSPRHAFFEVINLALLMSMAGLLALEVCRKGAVLMDKLLMGGGVACALYLVLQLAIYLSYVQTRTQPLATDLIVGYENYRFFNHVQTISLPLLGLLAARMADKGRRVFWWAVTALWWMLLFVTLGRGTLVGLVVGLCVVWMSPGKVAAPWCRQMLLAGLAGLGAYLLLYAAVPLALGMQPFGLFFGGVTRSLENPASGRWELWHRAVLMVLEHPWLGVGPAHFAHYPVDATLKFGSPHNWVLQVLSEWGLPAFLLLASALFLSLKRFWALRLGLSADQHGTFTALLVGGLAILLDGLVSGLIVMPASQIWLAVYLGLAWGWAVSLGQASSGEPGAKMAFTHDGRGRRVLPVFAVVAAVLCLTLLARGLWPDIRDKVGGGDVTKEKDAIFFPRVFLNGNF